MKFTDRADHAATLVGARKQDVLVNVIEMKNKIDDMLRSSSDNIAKAIGKVDGVHGKGIPPYVNLRWHRDRNMLDLDVNFTLDGTEDADDILRDVVRLFAAYGLTVSMRDIEVIHDSRKGTDTASNKRPISYTL